MNYEENLYLLDKFGNRELVCSLSEVCRKAKPWRLLNPIRLRPRRKPPAIPTGTYQGERADERHLHGIQINQSLKNANRGYAALGRNVPVVRGAGLLSLPGSSAVDAFR